MAVLSKGTHALPNQMPAKDDFSEGGVTPPLRNGPRQASLLEGEPLRDLNDLGPVRPGYCDFCGQLLPPAKLLYCDAFCKGHMDREYRNLGRTVAQIGMHWIEGRSNKGPALARMDLVLRNFRTRLRAMRRKYGWGAQ